MRIPTGFSPSSNLAHWLTALLALAGLAGLALALPAPAARLLSSAELAQVRYPAYAALAGRVTLTERDPLSGHFRVWLTDAAGSAALDLPPETAGRLAQAGQLPAPGDFVRAQGSVRLRADLASLNVAEPAAVSVQRPAPIPAALAGLHAGLAGRVVSVQARVVKALEPRPGWWQIELEDGQGRAELVFDSAAAGQLSAPPAFTPGQALELTAYVESAPGGVRLRLRRAADWQKLPALDAAETRLTSIARARLGRVGRVEGQITAVENNPGRWRFTLVDLSGSLQVLISERLYAQLPAAADLRPGARAQISGLVSADADGLYLTPEQSEQVNVLQAGPDPARPRTTDALGLAQVGEWVTLTGTLQISQTFTGGARWTLSDAHGALTVVLWDSVLAHLALDPAQPGQTVRVTGRVAEHEGQIELVPQLGFDVRVMRP